MHIIFPLCLQLFKVGCFKILLIKIKTCINHFCGGSYLGLVWDEQKFLLYVSPRYVPYARSMKAFSFAYFLPNSLLLFLLGFVKVEILIRFYFMNKDF